METLDYTQAVKIAKDIIRKSGDLKVKYDPVTMGYKINLLQTLTEKYTPQRLDGVSVSLESLTVFSRAVTQRERRLHNENKLLLETTKIPITNRLKQYDKLKMSTRIIGIATLQAQVDMGGFYCNDSLQHNNVRFNSVNNATA